MHYVEMGQGPVVILLHGFPVVYLEIPGMYS